MIKLSTSEQMNDETLVELTDEKKEQLKDRIAEISSSLSLLIHLVNQDELKISNRFSILGCVENYIGELASIVGYDSDIEKEQQRRSERIKNANIEIRRLEELVGSERGLDGIAEKLSKLSKDFHDNWKSMGFNLAYDSPMNEENPGGWGAGYGAINYYARLSTYITSRNSKDCKEYLDLFEAEGDSGHPQVLDTIKNREFIANSLQEKYPSLEILSWEIVQCYGRGSTDMQIRGLKIRIQDISDMEQ